METIEISSVRLPVYTPYQVASASPDSHAVWVCLYAHVSKCGMGNYCEAIDRSALVDLKLAQAGLKKR